MPKGPELKIDLRTYSNVQRDATVKLTLWGHSNNQVATVGFVSWGVN